MKLPVYFRQSWQIMFKDRQYSLIYIIGVALSMAFVMALLMFVLMSTRSIYPERDRDRMMLIGIRDGFADVCPDEYQKYLP